MFIADVDRPPTEAGEPRAGILQSFFARNRKPAETRRGKDLYASSVLQKVVEVIGGEPAGLAFIYETAGGLRVILAHRKIDPCSDEAARTLDFVGSDPLYLRLCRSQKSFRARLTPKPWRCGHHAPSERWPFLDTKTEKSSRFGRANTSGGFGTTRLFACWSASDPAKFIRKSSRFSLGMIKSGVLIAPICSWREADRFPFHRISSLCIATA